MSLLTTSEDFVLWLINHANQTAIGIDQISMGEPTNQSDTRDTTLAVTSIPKRGFTGGVNVQYDKMDLSELHKVGDLSFTVTDPELTTQMILDEIQSNIGVTLVLEEDVLEGIVNVLNDEVRPITIEASTTSKFWKGSITINVTAPVFEVYGNIQLITEPSQVAVLGRGAKTLGTGSVGNKIHIFEVENNNHWIYNMDTNDFYLHGQHPLYSTANPGANGEYSKKATCTSYDGTKIIINDLGRITFYDPETDTYDYYLSTNPSINATVNGRACILIDTPYGLYSLGGTGSLGSGIAGNRRHQIVFDHDNKTFTNANIAAIPNPPANLGFTTGVYYEDKMYVYGSGKNMSTTGQPYLSIYDFLTNTWTIESMPLGGDSFYSIVLGGKIVVVGGRDGAARTNTELSTTINLIWIYDPSDDTYTYTQSLTDIPFGGGFGYYNGALWVVKGTLNEGYDVGLAIDPFLDIIRIT